MSNRNHDDVAGCDTRNRLLILHALRLKGIASAATVAQTYKIDSLGLSKKLEQFRSEGLVDSRDAAGSAVSWLLTAAGRSEGERLLQQELEAPSRSDGHDTRAAVMELYRTFLPLNRNLLAVCTRWQVRSHDPVELNDHGDPAYDASVLNELQQINGQAQQICAELEGLLSRFGRYASGFDYALGRVHNGAIEWFTKPTLLSYHTLWFELHEDLLATLGLDRASETARQCER